MYHMCKEMGMDFTHSNLVDICIQQTDITQTGKINVPQQSSFELYDLCVLFRLFIAL